MAVRLYLCTTYTGIIITKINIAAFHSILHGISIFIDILYSAAKLICASDASFVSVGLAHCMFRAVVVTEYLRYNVRLRSSLYGTYLMRALYSVFVM